jgi:hypothetical protein
MLALSGLSLPSPLAAKNCNNLKPNNPDPAVTLTVTQTASLGTVARPDLSGGSALITLSPTGTRTIPPNLVINRDLGIPGRQPQAATVQISGGADCDVTVTVISTSGNLQSVVLRNSATGTNFSSGTKLQLNGVGSLTFTVGVSEVVNSTTSVIGGSITIEAAY